MFKDFTIDIYEGTFQCTEAAFFVKRHHYLKSISRGNKHVFVLRVEGEIKGVALFGTPVGANVNRCYGEDIIELKRFVLHECPKNTASWFMSRCIGWIKRFTTIKGILSYADPSKGHEGIIYKASNFQYLGKQKIGGYMFRIRGSYNWIHQRNFYHKGPEYNKLQKASRDGNIIKKKLKPKHIFLYKLA